LVLPCAYLCYCQNVSKAVAENDQSYTRSKAEVLMDRHFWGYLLRFGLLVVALFSSLMFSSVALMGGQLHFLRASFWSWVMVHELTPNVGIFWYIFIEVFDRYRTLFLFAFHAHLFFYPIPLHMRFGRHRPFGPWLHAVATVGMVTIFKPYPTASDFGLMLSMLLIPVELIKEAEKTFAFLLICLEFGLCMFPTMEAVWLSRNAGNANFLYNMTLVVNVFGCLLLTEWLRAGQKMRKRAHATAFCRNIIMDIVDQVGDKHN